MKLTDEAAACGACALKLRARAASPEADSAAFVAFLAILGLYPLSVWAIVLARRAQRQARANADPASVAAARSAETLAFIAVGLGVVVTLLVGIVSLVAGARSLD